MTSMALPETPTIVPLSGPSIVPSVSSLGSYRSSSTISPVVCDERAITSLLELLLSKGGLSVNEASRRMGVTQNAVRQYIVGRRTKPSLLWFVKFAELCGARVVVEFPGRG
jgi:hypothetical protein